MKTLQHTSSCARLLLAALGLSLAAVGSHAATVDLQGDDGTGYLGLSRFKVWATLAQAEASLFPYYEVKVGNSSIFPTIAALPQSADTTYFEESLGIAVQNKARTQSDFSTFSAGSIVYDDSVLTGSGTEVIGVSALSLTFNNAGFSPALSPYNDNVGASQGNFGFSVVLTASNLSGNGLTFTNGVLTSVDLGSDISIAVTGLGATFQYTYDGSLSVAGNSYVFDVNQQKTNSIVILDCEIVPGECIEFPPVVFNDTRVVLNRAGTIAAVSPVPEPATYAMMLAGLVAVGGWARRRQRG